MVLRPLGKSNAKSWARYFKILARSFKAVSFGLSYHDLIKMPGVKRFSTKKAQKGRFN